MLISLGIIGRKVRFSRLCRRSPGHSCSQSRVEITERRARVWECRDNGLHPKLKGPAKVLNRCFVDA